MLRLSHVLIAGTVLLIVVANMHAGDDLRAEANALLVSTRKTSIWTPDVEPFPYHEQVTFTLRGMTSVDVNGSFEKDYSSKRLWRWRYELPGYAEIEVRNGSQIGERSTTDFEPLRLQQLRSALPPKVVALENTDVIKKISHAKLNGVQVRCIDSENIRGKERSLDQVCIDPVLSTLMRWRHGDIEIEWFDFIPFRDKFYPKHVVVRERDRKLVEAEVEFREAPDLKPEMFQLPTDMSVRRACDHVAHPIWISGELPEYPVRVFSSRPVGNVVVQLKVGADGHVKAAHVMETSGRDLDTAAENAVKQWVFEPAKCDGEPFEQRINVEVRFRTR